MDFIDMLLTVQPRRRVRVRPDERPCVVVASDAQVEPGSLPGGGVLIEDLYTDSKQAGWVTFTERMLQVWDLDLASLAAGRQPQSAYWGKSILFSHICGRSLAQGCPRHSAWGRSQHLAAGWAVVQAVARGARTPPWL